MSRKDSLFLHYGPGGNADIERAWLGSDFPGMDFWNQPVVHEGNGAYGILLKACENTFRDLVKKNQGPVTVWGHSFGCNIAIDVAARHPGDVKKLILFNPLSDIPTGFFRLAVNLSRDASTPESVGQGLVEPLKAFGHTIAGSSERLKAMWDLVGQIVKDPDFMRLYWVSPQVRKKYLSLGEKAAPLDLGMWQNVLNDYIRGFSAFRFDAIHDKMQIVMGEGDPYIETAHEKGFWEAAKPRDITWLKDVGHYSHLETPVQKIKKIAASSS